MIKKPADIPKLPGVYKFRDENNRVLYVGKAKNLNNRLSSYFNKNNLSVRISKMVDLASSLEWTIVNNEIEALTLEHSWIKEFSPRYNVIFRNDDRGYPYLAITNEEFPRVFITRKVKKSGAKYLGPFPQSWALNSTIDILQNALGFRTCSKGVFESSKRLKRPCLLGYIEKCSAPCINKNSINNYKESISKLEKFFKGDVQVINKQLILKMQNFSDSLKYEEAAKTRDQIEAIKIVIEKNSTELSSDNNLDLIGVHSEDLEFAVHIFIIRKGKVVGEKVLIGEHDIQHTEHDKQNNKDGNANSIDQSLIDSVFYQFYIENRNEIPHEIVTIVMPSNQITELLEKKRDTKINIHIGNRGDKARLLKSAINNAIENMQKAKKNRTTDLTYRTKALDEIQKYLNLKAPPLRMECYDISHTLGSFQTGSMVVFEDGLPKKKDYRLFNIKDKKATDDTAAIYEVISRRLKYISSDNSNISNKTSFSYPPNLLVIDGGKPQVNAAFKAIKDCGLTNHIIVCSLAKRLEEIWIPNEEWPIILPRDSAGLYMLQYLRDESHRFSIINMRKRRDKHFKKEFN